LLGGVIGFLLAGSGLAVAAAQPALAARQNATSVSYALATTTTPSLSITPQAPVALPLG